MPRIYTRVVCYRLFDNSTFKPISHKKHKMGEEKRATIGEEVQKLRFVDFITKVKYPSWLANMV